MQRISYDVSIELQVRLL